MIYRKTYSRIVLIGNWIFDKLHLDLVIIHSPIARVRWQMQAIIDRNGTSPRLAPRLASARDLIALQQMPPLLGNEATSGFSQRITPTFENSRLSDPVSTITGKRRIQPNYIFSRLIKK